MATNSNDSVSTLTKREHFAVMAMQGLLMDNHTSFHVVSKQAVQMADLLIKELNKE